VDLKPGFEEECERRPAVVCNIISEATECMVSGNVNGGHREATECMVSGNVNSGLQCVDRNVCHQLPHYGNAREACYSISCMFLPCCDIIHDDMVT
jgi:hypothetical protein